MGNIEFDIDAHGHHKAIRDVKRAIENGIDEAAREIGAEAQAVAQSRILQEGAIFTGDLVGSFEWMVMGAGDTTKLRVINTSDHAAPIEYGAEYGAQGPPVAALLPWVEAKLGHWDFDTPPTGGTDVGFKEFNPTEAADHVESNTSFNNLDPNYDTHPRLSDPDEFESFFEFADGINEDAAGEVLDAFKSWKGSSGGGSEAVLYENALKIIHDSEVDIKRSTNPDLFDAPSTAEIGAFQAFQELSQRFVRQNADINDDGTITLHRGLNRHEVGETARDIWDNPLADEWATTENPANNYTFEEWIAHNFGDGITVVGRDVDVDDVVAVPDSLLDADNIMEGEIHVIGRASPTIKRSQLVMDSIQDNPNSDASILNQDFADADFSSFTDEELMSLVRMINHMYSSNDTPTTQAGADRLRAWRDEVLDRGVFEDFAGLYSEDRIEHYIRELTHEFD